MSASTRHIASISNFCNGVEPVRTRAAGAAMPVAPSSRLSRFLLGVACLVLFCAICLAFLPATAQAVATTPTSAECSVDGKDYGWLWRASDDCFYRLGHGTSPIYCVCGYARDDQGVSRVYGYPTVNNVRENPGCIMPSEVIYETLYRLGTLTYSYGPHIRLELIIPNGMWQETYYKRMNVFGTGAKAFSSPNAYSSLKNIRFDPKKVKHVIIEDTVARYWRETTPEQRADGDDFLYLNDWFSKCYDLTSIEGFEYLSDPKPKSMARMFLDCRTLPELDLSDFDTSSCEDFDRMLSGCLSLDSLVLGDGWTQAAAPSELHATFPRQMMCEESGILYPEGAVIPDGAGTYNYCSDPNRKSLDDAVVLLGEPGQTANTQPGELTCEYTGAAVKPSVSVRYEDGRLKEGVDYRVSYSDNVAEGVGHITIRGRDIYTGSVTLDFAIADTSAHVFLYDDGTLFIKANHAEPEGSAVARAGSVAKAYCWFNGQTPNPGADVPWAAQASKVKKVVIDESFAKFQPTTAERWFAGCVNLTSVRGLGNVDLSVATSVGGMFQGCASLIELDLSALDTANVCDFSDFARDCTSLETLNLGSLDMSRATDATGFYEGCSALKNLSVTSGWSNSAAGLVFADVAYRVSPTFDKFEAGTPVPSGAGDYRTSEIPMQAATIEMPSSNYDFTGSAIKPKPEVMLGNLVLVEGKDYTLAYANNVNPGIAKLTVRGKGVFSGGLVANYAINPVITKAGDLLTYKDKHATYALKVTKVAKKNGLVTKANVTITKVTVNNKSMAKLSLPSTCTIGGVKLSITAVGNKLKGTFRNVKTVVVGSTMTRIGSRAFANAPKVKTLQIKSKRLTKVTNCLKGSKVTKVQVKVGLSSAKKKSYKKMFTKKAGKSITYKYG